MLHLSGNTPPPPTVAAAAVAVIVLVDPPTLCRSQDDVKVKQNLRE